MYILLFAKILLIVGAFAYSYSKIFDKDLFSFNQTLGWSLGYRNIIYNDIGQVGTSFNAEAVIDISGPRYVILSIDDFVNLFLDAS